MAQQTPLHLVNIAEEIVRRKEVTLETDNGLFDHTELKIEWVLPGFYATLTGFTEGRTWPATLYQPAETEWLETEETGQFNKIADLAEWAGRFGVDV